MGSGKKKLQKIAEDIFLHPGLTHPVCPDDGVMVELVILFQW
jgi:hypothetical protein